MAAGKIKNELLGYVFLGMSFVIMTLVALRKHDDYLREFNGENGKPLYPKERRALIPFLI